MNARVVLTSRALDDLDKIWDYTTGRWGLAQAEANIRQLREQVQTISSSPSLGRQCEEVRAGYRKYPAGAYVLFYRTSDKGVEIARILHGQMDFERDVP